MEQKMIPDLEHDCRDLFYKTIKDAGLKFTSVAEKAIMSKGHLSNVLTKKQDITEDNRRRLNQILGTNY